VKVTIKRATFTMHQFGCYVTYCLSTGRS